MRQLLQGSLVAIAACVFVESAAAGALNIANLNEYVDLGYGYNPVVGKFYRPCIGRQATPTDISKEGVGNPTESYKIDEITSSSQIKSAFGLNAYVMAFSPTTNISANMQKMLQTEITTEHTYFYISVSVSGITVPLKEKIVLTDDALEILKGGESEFKKWCGDSFVEALVGGGSFVAIGSIDKLSNSETKSFLAVLEASTKSVASGAQISVGDTELLSKMTQERHVLINIVQVGSVGSSLTSLTDIAAFLERARTFAEDIRTHPEHMAVTGILYKEYTEDAAFGAALKKASLARFASFQTSPAIMTDIVNAYDAASDALDLVRQVRLNRSEFEPITDDDLKMYEDQYANLRGMFGSLAKQCADLALNGDNCVDPRPKVSLGFDPPKKIVRLEPCTLAAFRERHGTPGNTCISIARRQDKCVCSACMLYQNPPYNAFPGGVIDQCVGMPANASITLHFTGRVRFDHQAKDHWLAFYLYTDKSQFTIVQRAGLPGNFSDWDKIFDGSTSELGQVRATLREWACQTNVKLGGCSVDKLNASYPGLLDVRLQDPAPQPGSSRPN